jgi:hypothetical protein
MYQQLWGYKVEEKLYLGVREQKRLNTTGVDYNIGYSISSPGQPTVVISSIWWWVQQLFIVKSDLL